MTSPPWLTIQDDSGLATKREVAAWIDIGGNIVQAKNAFGCD